VDVLYTNPGHARRTRAEVGYYSAGGRECPPDYIARHYSIEYSA
jgi:hypothetical protein